MVTKSEKLVVDEMKEKGYNYVHAGSPDFIFYRLKTKSKQFSKKQIKTIQGKPTQLNANQFQTNPTIQDIDIGSVEFIEVKYNGDVLSHEQQIWRHILKELGMKYKLIHIPLKISEKSWVKKHQENTMQTKTSPDNPRQTNLKQPKTNQGKPIQNQFIKYSNKL